MPAGMQIFDAVGNVTLEVTDTPAKYLGQLSVAASGGTPQSGTITDGGFLLGSLWFLTTLPPTVSLVVDDSVGVAISGNTLTWATEANTPAFVLYYGVI